MRPSLAGIAVDVRLVELGAFAPARWADALAAVIVDDDDDDVVVLPASPDGRDLAPRLAHRLGRPLLAGAIAVSHEAARLVRGGGLELHDVEIHGPVVATLQPGVRGVTPSEGLPSSEGFLRPVRGDRKPSDGCDGGRGAAARRRDDRPRRGRLGSSPAGPGWTGRTGSGSSPRSPPASARRTGATRVVTDRGWVGHERQIGTTGVTVDPELYVAFGDQRRRAAHRRARRPRPHHQREHRSALSDDADGRPRRGQRRQRRARRTGSEARWLSTTSSSSAPAPPAPARPPSSPAPGAGSSSSSGARSPAARTCTAGSSTRASSTGSIRSWWEEAPIQRWVTRRSTMLLTATQAVTVDIRTAAWGAAAVQRGDRLPARLRPLARRQGRGRRRRAGLLHDRRRPAAGTGRSGRRRAHRPARRRRPGEGRHRLRRGQQLLRQGGRAPRTRSTRRTTRSASRRRSPCRRR